MKIITKITRVAIPLGIISTSTSCLAPSLDAPKIEKNKPAYSHYIATRHSQSSEFQDVVDGQLTVIFNDSYNIRPTPDEKEFSSKIRKDISNELNNALSSLGVVKIQRYCPGFSEEELAKYESKAEASLRRDVPNLASISSIQFKSQDSAKYAKAYLQNHPSVSTVYFTPKIQGGSEIWRWDNSNLSGPLPSTTTPDPELLKNEQDNWYWVNRHKVLQSWSEINFSNLPEVVVIDSGFDIDATISDDRPNYSLSDARYIDQDGNASPKGAHFADPSLIREPSGNTYSHGTMVSSIISAPKGNSVGLFGIVPGMPVIPFKIYSINGKNFDNGSGITECSIVSAILLSNTQTNSRVTSISISPVGGPLTVLPGIRAVVDTVSRNGQIVVFCSGNQLMDTGSLASYVDSGQIVVGGTQANGRNWREWSSKKNTWIGANYGSWVDLAASANDIYVFDYNPSTNTRISRLVGGTSFSTPMVAATAAITRQLFLTNGGTYGYELELVRIIRDILIYSSSFGQSSDGTKQGRGLVRSSSSEEVPDIRELNVANSYRIAKSATRNPMIRMTNVDDETRAYYNASTYYLKTTAPKGSDVMLDSTDDAVNIIDIGTHNTSGVRSHGYQLWRYGKIVTEEVKGVAERHAPWGKLYDTRGEDAGSTSTGWNYWVYWRKIP